MSASMAKRLDSLRDEFDKGQNVLAELDQRRERLKDSMLRIAGAIQVLEELAGEEEGEADSQNA